MRVLFIADRSFATRERAMLSRLEVGLAGEGVRVVRAVPPMEITEPSTGFAEQFFYPPDGPLATLLRLRDRPSALAVRGQARHVARKLDDLDLPGGEGPIDVVHAWGEGCWSLAFETASLVGAAIAADVWSGALVKSLRGYERHHVRSAESQSLTWLAPNESLRTSVLGAHTRWPCRMAPWGVHVPRETSAWGGTDRPVSVVVLSSGHDEQGLLAALRGLAAALASSPDALVFLDAAGMKDHRRTWGALKTLGLLDRVSVIPDVESRRDLALRADVLVQPDRGAGQRSFVLDAMAAGMTIIARRDEHHDELVDGQTALLVVGPSAEGWERAIRRALSDPVSSRAVGEAARSYVREHRQVSRQVRSLMDAYDRMTSSSGVPSAS